LPSCGEVVGEQSIDDASVPAWSTATYLIVVAIAA
jgi:hypothetical protein